MLYSSTDCNNSVHWDNLKSIQVLLVIVGLIVFITALVVCGIYLAKRKKNKKKAKKFLTACAITFICSILLMFSGKVLGDYIHSKTKDLGYCWSKE